MPWHLSLEDPEFNCLQFISIITIWAEVFTVGILENFSQSISAFSKDEIRENKVFYLFQEILVIASWTLKTPN